MHYNTDTNPTSTLNTDHNANLPSSLMY